MRDRSPARRLACGAFHIDVDPLLVAGRFGEFVDAILRDLDPLADTDLGTTRRCFFDPPMRRSEPLHRIPARLR